MKANTGPITIKSDVSRNVTPPSSFIAILQSVDPAFMVNYFDNLNKEYL